jgi:hypothetical protein
LTCVPPSITPSGDFDSIRVDHSDGTHFWVDILDPRIEDLAM